MRQFLARIFDPNSDRTATLVLLTGQLIAAGGAFLVNVLAASMLVPSGRGDLAFAIQMAYLFTVLAGMGLERPYIASRVGSFDSEYFSFAKMVYPGAIASIPLVFLATFFAPFETNWFWMGAIGISAYVVFNTLMRGIRVGYVASRNWKVFSTNSILVQLTLVLGAALLVVFEISSPMVWMWLYVASAIPALLLLFKTFRRRSTIPKIASDEKKRLRRRGWILLPADFSNTAMLRSDRLLLPILSSSAELGLYVTVATVLEMSAWPLKQWVDTSLHRWSKAGARLDEMIRQVFLRALLLLVGLTFLLSLAAYVVVLYMLPDSYRGATVAILPLSIASVIFGLTRVQQGMLIAWGESGRVSIVEIIGTSISLIAYLILIPNFGMLGAAYGSIIGYLGCFVAASVALAQVRRVKKTSE